MNELIKERPILFSSEMVRAILGGRKTQTRRVIITEIHVSENMPLIPDKEGWYLPEYRCKYGKPGDQLWVKETFLYDGADVRPERMKKEIIYKAKSPEFGEYYKWKPSIYMPRWASRIDLLVKNIRVERIQDISQEDAKAEGVNALTLSDGGFVPLSGSDYIGAFRFLWNSINLKRGYGWDVNPWVWVIEFERIEKQQHAYHSIPLVPVLSADR